MVSRLSGYPFNLSLSSDPKPNEGVNGDWHEHAGDMFSRVVLSLKLMEVLGPSADWSGDIVMDSLVVTMDCRRRRSHTRN